MRPVLTLVSGAAAAQAVVFLARPVLTRLYTPEEFGVLTVFVTLVTILATAGSGRYEDALMLPEDDREASEVLAVAGLASLGAAILTGFALLWLPVWEAMLGGPTLRPAILLLPPTLLLTAWALALEVWQTRKHRFRTVAAGRSLQSAIVAAVQLAGGIAAVGAVGLVAGAVAGFAAGTLWLGGRWWVSDGPRPLRDVQLRHLPAIARRYARFPLYSAPAALLNVLASRAPVLLLAALFTTEAVGQFGIAFGTLVLPLGLVAGAIGQVFFVRAAEAYRADRLGSLTLAFYRRLLAATTYPALAVLVAGPTLFAFVFGPDWDVAGRYAQALAVWVLLLSVAVPLTRVFDVTERQQADLGFSLFLFVVQTGAFVTASLTLDAFGAILTLGIVGAGVRALHIGWMLRTAGAPLGEALLHFVRITALALPALGLVALVQSFTDSGSVVLAAVVLGGLVYLALAAWSGDLGEPDLDSEPEQHA